MLYYKNKYTSAVRSKILSKLIVASCVWYSDRAYYGECVLIKDIGRRLPLKQLYTTAVREWSYSVSPKEDVPPSLDIQRWWNPFCEIYMRQYVRSPSFDTHLLVMPTINIDSTWYTAATQSSCFKFVTWGPCNTKRAARNSSSTIRCSSLQLVHKHHIQQAVSKFFRLLCLALD